MTDVLLQSIEKYLLLLSNNNMQHPNELANHFCRKCDSNMYLRTFSFSSGKKDRVVCLSWCKTWYRVNSLQDGKIVKKFYPYDKAWILQTKQAK